MSLNEHVLYQLTILNQIFNMKNFVMFMIILFHSSSIVFCMKMYKVEKKYGSFSLFKLSLALELSSGLPFFKSIVEKFCSGEWLFGKKWKKEERETGLV